MKTFKEFLVERGLDREQEHENFKVSAMRHSHEHEGWKVKPTVHGASQAHERRPDLDEHSWKSFHHSIVKHAAANPKKSNGEFLFTSKSRNQSVMANVDHKAKELRIMTVLPKGNHVPLHGTKKYMIEGLIKHLEEIFVD